MNVRNEVRSHLACEGVTMQDALGKLEQQYGWSRSISNLSGNSIEKHCDIRKPWSWQMCWVTRLFGKRGVSAYGERTGSECR